MAATRDFEQVNVEETDADVTEVIVGRRQRRLLAGVATGLAAVGACAAVWRGRGCVPLTESAVSSVTSFVQEYPTDMLKLVERRGDEDAVQRWLSSESAAAQLAREHEQFRGSVKVAQDAVEQAMKETDPLKAKAVIKEAMQRSVAQTVSKRRDLKDYVASQRRGLKGQHTDSPQQQAYTAYCVFDTLQATNSIAFIAANLNDAFQTCGAIKLDNILEKHNTHGKICAINVATAFTEIANLAAMLSLAANDCAATLVPNVDALCAASVSGLVYGLGSAAAGGALMAASCNKRFMGSEVPAGAVPSTIGSNRDMGLWAPKNRRLQENATAAAPARQLLFGGGHASTGTQCGIEVTNILWSLGKALLGINAAVNGNLGSTGKCPPTNILGGKLMKGPYYKINEAFCAQNIGGILVAYSQIIGFLQIAIVDCEDVLNLDAICGAGVTAMLGSFAAITQAGSGVHLACDTMQDPLLKKALNAAAKIDNLSGNKISEILGGGKVLGRRLSEGSGLKLPEGVKPTAEEAIDMSDEELAHHFGTPQDLFKHLGIDLNDKALKEQRPAMPDVTGLFQKPGSAVVGAGQCVA